MNKLQILCVDDDPIMQRIYNIILSEKYHLDIATTGHEAVQCCQTKTYDAILMDIRLPGLTGFEATAYIHGLDNNCHTPIIGITACGWEHLVDDTSKTAFNQLLNKPIPFEDMLKAIEKATCRTEVK